MTLLLTVGTDGLVDRGFCEIWIKTKIMSLLNVVDRIIWPMKCSFLLCC